MANLSIRRANIEDEAAVASLVSEDPFTTRSRYGLENVHYLIENSLLSVTVLDEKGLVIGFVAFTDFPVLATLENVTNADWEPWFRNTYGHKEIPVSSVIWLGFFVADCRYEAQVGSLVMRTLFETMPEIQLCLIVTRFGQAAIYPFDEVAKDIKPENFELDETIHYSIYKIEASNYMAEVKVRRARVEDHDDLVPVFNEQSEVLTERYGEFFLASLIESQDDDNKALVAEVRGRAAGLLALTTILDVHVLQQCFDLQHYDSLVKIPAELRTQRSQRSFRAKADSASTASLHNGSVDGNAEAPPSQSTGSLHSADQDNSHDPIRQPHHPEDHSDGRTEQSLGTQYLVDGQCNAFAVTLFCLDYKYQSRSADLLRAAFELYPDKEYCVLTLPHTCQHFPFLLNFTFIPPRSSNTFTQVLYLVHRSALMHFDHVRPVLRPDLESINNLLTGVDEEEQENIMYAVNRALTSEPPAAVAAYVAVCAGVVVAVCVVGTEVDVEDLRARYNLDQFIDFRQYGPPNHAILRHFVINPIFAPKTRYFFKEIFRKSRRCCLYYLEYPDSPVPSILPHLIKVPPRRQVQVPRQPHNSRSFALHFLTTRYITDHKTVVNARVVVVGASDTAISYLETLVMTPYLHLSSITLVSPGGLPSGPAPGEPQFVASSHCYTTQEYQQIALGSNTNVIDAKMVNVDRGKKQLLLTQGFVVPYDYLVLTVGLQDQSLTKLGAQASRIKGVFSLSNEVSVEQLRAHIPQSFLNGWGMAVVYGATLTAYCTLQGLMQSGVSASRIVMVLPPPADPDNHISCFNNPRIDAQMGLELENLGVQVHHNAVLANVEADSDDTLTAVVLKGGWDEEEGGVRGSGGARQMQWVGCRVLVCCDEPNVDPQFFAAMNDNSIVYDGRLVVNHRFQTNDPAIFAAGPVVKFARKYRAKQLVQHYNSREVGAKLAYEMMKFFDPDGEEQLKPTEAAPNHQITSTDFLLLPTFTQPKARGGLLPGAHGYLHVESPGKPQPLEDAMARPNHGRELVRAVDDRDYLRLHVDEFDLCEAITYLGKDEIEVHNVLALVGMPVAYFNRVVQRYDEGLISDFVTFFRETWAFAVYHDRFTQFRQIVQQQLASQPDIHAIRALLQKTLDAQLPIDDELKAQVRSMFSSSSVRVVEQQLLQHLRRNKGQLNMFFIPGETDLASLSQPYLNQ